MITQFNRFEIEMTRKQAESASHSGACDADVEILVRHPSIKLQLDNINPMAIAAELAEYTDWDVTDAEANKRRIVWLAAGQIMDELVHLGRVKQRR